MSQQLISRSPDLKRLRDDGYEVEINGSYLVLNHVPYVNSDRAVAYGTLVSTLTLGGDVAVRPDTHVAMFAGEVPCDQEGSPLTQILNSSGRQDLLPGLAIDHVFSSKPAAGYADYYEKMTTYAAILGSAAQAIDPDATAMTFRVIEDDDEDAVFRYRDTASSRAGIGAITAKLEVGKVAIVGMGGTGSYILDLVAKVPVAEIHLFDGDRFLSHNAFRAPGAALIDDLRAQPTKVAYFQKEYSKVRRGIIAHETNVDLDNVDMLRDMNFVFLALDDGAAKKLLVERLEEFEIPFIDVGMGLYQAEGSLAGLVRVTTSTPEQRDHVWKRSRIPFESPGADNEYAQNIQIADMNALNAALAVIKWKKLLGFYSDLDREHFAVYQVDGNSLLNEDRP